MANHLFELEGGRTIGVSANGDPAAMRLVVFCHPTPGSGSFDPDPVVTARWGVHLLSVDRPGYGASEALGEGDDHSFAARADDVASFVKYSERAAQSSAGTDFGRIGVIGWQSGGLVALALAARYPRLVDRLALVDTPALVNPAQHGRDASFTIADLGIADDDSVLRRPGLGNRLDRMFAEASVQGNAGVAADQAAFGEGLREAMLGDVVAQTKLVYGEGESSVSIVDGKWFARRLQNATVARVQNGRALSVVTQWQNILKHVAPRHGARRP